MENERAIEIIKGELRHCQIHMKDKNKASEYYQELNELCEAYETAIKALENSSPVLMMQNMSAEDIEKIKLIWQRKTSKGISNQILVNDEYKERALAIVDVYSDSNRISQRDAEILRKAIMFYSRGETK